MSNAVYLSQIAPVGNGTAGQVLTSGGAGASAAWVTVLPVANGGTGVTSSTGTGSVVLSTSATFVTPILGTPTSVTLTNATGLPLSTGVTGTLALANGGTGATTVAAAQTNLQVDPAGTALQLSMALS